MLLKTAAGETITVDGSVQTTHWEGESALLISVRRAAWRGAAREKLRFAERRADELQAVLDTATDGVVILDGDGRIVGINRSAEALFGYEVSARSPARACCCCSRRKATAPPSTISTACKSNGVASVLNDGREVMGRVRQGGLVPLFMTIGRLGDVEGNRFCAVLRDLTSFKKAESELMARQAPGRGALPRRSRTSWPRSRTRSARRSAPSSALPR